MKKAEVMGELKALGTAQNCKVYARHGVQGTMFGVSYANLGKLKRKIGTNHALALELWSTGNHDARVLAGMVADPSQAKAAELEGMVKDVDSYPLADAFAGVAAGAPAAAKLAAKWARSKKEFISTCGWNVVGHLAGRPEADEGWLRQLVADIEARIHANPSHTRYAMNQALICIGSRGGELQTLATASAGRIGTVEVDHGETDCKTPDAASYIAKVVAHRKGKTAKARARKA